MRHIFLTNLLKPSRMLPFKLLWVLLVTVMLAVSCVQRKLPRANRGFYYWKSTFNLKSSDMATLTRLGVSHLYVKFFDVSWANGPVPLSAIRFNGRPPRNLRIVPTIFITNDTLNKLSSNSIVDLARKICFKIRHIGQVYALPAFNEVQLDCDWTDSTRKKYFDLLWQMKREWSEGQIQISATIRLHQIKYYRHTGVPPVGRGVLMFYNMADLTDFNTSNSILDLKVARRYTTNLRYYPLSLDVALPLYSWGVVFQDRRFIGLARGFRLTDMRRSAFDPYRENIFRARSNVYLHGTQLYRDDLIRVEESTFEACRQSAKLLKRNLKLNSRNRILFFDFDQTEIGAMGLEKVDQIYNSFN